MTFAPKNVSGGTQRTTAAAHLTVVTSQRPTILSKLIRRDAHGDLLKSGGGVLVEGEGRIRQAADLARFAEVLLELGPDQALTYGVPRRGDGPILSRAVHARLGHPTRATTRTRDQFIWPDGPGILMLDYDPNDVVLGCEDLVAILREAAPGLAEARMLWWPSASSHIFDAATGEDLTGLRGQRLYLMVADATDIPRAGAALVDRLWAAGHGRIEISTAGTALERCPTDASVWQPERLDFAAGAVCAEGLQQRRGDPVSIPGDTPLVDTRQALPDDPKIAEAAAGARKRARSDADDELRAVREAYLDKHAEAMVPPEKADDPDALEQARTTVRRALDRSVLEGDFPIEIQIAPGHFETLTVDDILDDRARFHGRLTRDPIEPDYDGGRPTGKLFLLDARPILFSFAHGGRSFRLIRQPAPIEVPAGRTTDATDATLRKLREDPAIFDFGGQVALVEAGQLMPLDEHALGNYLGGVLQFWKSRKGQGGEPEQLLIDPPARLVRQILSLGTRRRLQPLSAIVTAPTLRPDGSVLSVPGHDDATALLLDPGDREMPVIPDHPSRDEVTDALNRLMHPVREFPVVDALARGAMLAALLTAAVRSALTTAPAFAVDAPVQGSGKTLLASCIAALATGDVPEVWPHTAGRDDEEVRKRLFTALRDGARALIWDNVTGVLDSAALAAAITAPTLRDRVLGRSESLAIPNRALLLLTGNNFCPAGDLPRRVLPIRIDPRTETPFARQFDLDPLTYVLDHRLDLVAAALTLVRGWLTSGAPRAPGRMASFESWDDLVRQTVCWVGREVAPGAYGDPMDLIRQAQRSDPEQESLFALLEALTDLYPGMWFTARDVAQRAHRARTDHMATPSETALMEAVVDIAGDRALGNSRSIGRVLKFREDRIVFGLRLASRQHGNIREFRIEHNAQHDVGTDRFNRSNRFNSEDLKRTTGAEDESEPSDLNRLDRLNRPTVRAAAFDPEDFK